MKLNIRKEFVKTFDETYDFLYHYASGFVNDGDDAKDIVHDAFVYAWNNRGDLDFSCSIKPYLLKVVRNYSLNHIRNKSIRDRHHNIIKYVFEDVFIPDYEEHNVLIEKITTIIDKLPEQCSKVFKMSVYDGLRYKEIADNLGITVNTVKTHISKALKILRAEVGEKSILLVSFLLLGR